MRVALAAHDEVLLGTIATPKVRVERRGGGLLVARLMLYKHWVPYPCHAKV